MGDRLVLHVLPHSFPTRRSSGLFSGGSIGVRDRFHRLYAFGRGGNDLAKAREEFAGEPPCRPVNEARPELGQLAADVGLHLEVQHRDPRSEEHTSELQSLMRISYAVFCLKNKTTLRPKKQ